MSFFHEFPLKISNVEESQGTSHTVESPYYIASSWDRLFKEGCSKLLLHFYNGKKKTFQVITENIVIHLLKSYTFIIK